jgi:hypothetical protein
VQLRRSDMRHLYLALALLPLGAQATPLLVPLSRGVDLRSQSVTDPGGADLVVQSRSLSAPYGIRCVAGDVYGPKAPAVSGAACEVRDGTGSVYDVRVTSVSSVSVSLEVRPNGTLAELSVPAPLEALPPSGEAGILARFEMSSYSIDGSLVSTAFPQLVLRRDRSYLFGDHRGRWTVVDGLLLLDGEYTRWGAGALDAASGRLTFHSSGPRFAVSAALVRVESGKVLLTRAQP